MNLGFIKFAPRNNLPLNSIWMLKDVRLTEFVRENVFKISPTEFYKNSVGIENKITEINSNGENFSKLFSVINVENLTEYEKNVVAIMAHYDSENKLSRLSDLKHVTISPQNITRIELFLSDVYFNDKNAKTKVFLIEDMEMIKPIENAMQIAITDLPEIRDRLQVGIYSSSLNPNTVINELDQEGNFITVDYTLDDPAQGFGAEAALDKIKIMVCAYSSIGNSYYKNSILKEKIDLALSAWTTNDYTCKTNWWYNEISVPKKISDILIYNLPYATYSDKLYEIAKRGLPNLSPNLPHGSLDTGANLIDKLLIGLKIAVATNDPQAIKTYVTGLLDGELKIFPLSKEGMMQDGSFQQHSALLYNGSYGVVFVNGINKLLAYLQNTDYMVSDRAVSTYTDFILDGQQYMFRDNTFDFSVAGRSISRKNAISTSVKNGVSGAVDLLLSLSLGYRQNELQTLQNNRLLGLDNQTNRTKHFWVSDFTVAHRSNYYVSVRGASSRVKKTEYMNGENSKGYFLADGSTTILKDGTEYENIYPVWDWNKIPGTTSVQVESIPIVGHEYGGSKFVGGLSNQNMAISAIKINNTRTDTQLNAKKAYFIFDEGFIALGNEINSNLQKEVVTSLNQALLKGNIIYKDTSVKTLASNTLGQIQNVNWVLHDKTGYLFNIPKAVTISNKVQTGKWSDINLGQSTELVSQNVFSLFLSHGMAPLNGAYSYIVLPNTTQAYIENYMINPNIVEISNNSNNTSVWNKNKNTLGIVFWESGTCIASKSITGHFEQINVISSQPCVAFVRRIDNGYELTVSDPTQELISIDIYINGKLTTINLPTGNNAGNSVTLNIYQ